MSKLIDGERIKRNLNRLQGYTVMGVKANDISFKILFMSPTGEEVTITQANAFGLSAKESKSAVVLSKLITPKHQDDCKDLKLDQDIVVGTIVEHVNVYYQGKGIYANRISLSFILNIPGTKQKPGIMVSTDLSSEYTLGN